METQETESGKRKAESGKRKAESGMRNAECGMRNAECGMRKRKAETEMVFWAYGRYAHADVCVAASWLQEKMEGEREVRVFPILIIAFGYYCVRFSLSLACSHISFSLCVVSNCYFKR